jgi:hypothetical protein
MAPATTSLAWRSTALARAYGGPAHGQCWSIEGEDPPAEVVVVPDGPGYRLIHHPRTHHPAKDHLGNYLYMPVSPQADGHNLAVSVRPVDSAPSARQAEAATS